MENSLVEPIKTLQRREYHLSAPVYHQMGRSSVYIRRPGFDEIQKEKMIVKYIKTNRSITRTQTAELCRITSMVSKQVTY
ncbi:hypothetical protein [Trichormus azollae]|jgi:hypothetical protein|uniref:hypothetical protein n=1 Tax=Trichormus azollae TaxID=1164 RepID=UPI0001957842|nr:hypothetical protein [Trichormus azollae]